MSDFSALKGAARLLATTGATAFGINYIDNRMNNLNIDPKTLALYRTASSVATLLSGVAIFNTLDCLLKNTSLTETGQLTFDLAASAASAITGRIAAKYITSAYTQGYKQKPFTWNNVTRLIPGELAGIAAVTGLIMITTSP